MTAFRRGWLKRGTVYGDEGFSVGIADRTTLIYKSQGKKMTIAGELLTNGFAGNRVNMKTWDDGTPLSSAEQEQVADNITRALASEGEIAYFD